MTTSYSEVRESPDCPRDGCNSSETVRFGMTQDGEYTYRCRDCDRGFSAEMVA